MKTLTDRPPILRTALIFAAGLVLVTGLAAFSYVPELPSGDARPASDTPQAGSARSPG